MKITEKNYWSQIMHFDRLAMKESFTDKIWGTIINFPLNYVLILFCLKVEMTPLNMSVFMTAVIFCFAIFRSYFIRIYFKGKLNE